MEHEVKISKVCPMCGVSHTLTMNNKMAIQLSLYLQGMGYAQDTLADFNEAEREFVKTGFCLTCQDILFAHSPGSSRIQEA